MIGVSCVLVVPRIGHHHLSNQDLRPERSSLLRRAHQRVMLARGPGFYAIVRCDLVIMSTVGGMTSESLSYDMQQCRKISNFIPILISLDRSLLPLTNICGHITSPRDSSAPRQKCDPSCSPSDDTRSSPFPRRPWSRRGIHRQSSTACPPCKTAHW